jgi:hypothetical protein
METPHITAQLTSTESALDLNTPVGGTPSKPDDPPPDTGTGCGVNPIAAL